MKSRKPLSVGDRVRITGPSVMDITDCIGQKATVDVIHKYFANVSCDGGGNAYSIEFKNLRRLRPRSKRVTITREELAKAWNSLDPESIAVEFRAYSGVSRTFKALAAALGLGAEGEGEKNG